MLNWRESEKVKIDNVSGLKSWITHCYFPPTYFDLKACMFLDIQGLLNLKYIFKAYDSLRHLSVINIMEILVERCFRINFQKSTISVCVCVCIFLLFWKALRAYHSTFSISFRRRSKPNYIYKKFNVWFPICNKKVFGYRVLNIVQETFEMK